MYNYKELLNEIRSFVSCPKLIDPLENDERSCDLKDAELAEQLDSQLLNVLVSSSSLCDSESLISEFSLSSDEDEEDDLDRIVEQLQNVSDNSNEKAVSSMPTISSLFNVPAIDPSTVNPKPPATKPNDKEKAKFKKKIKFTQHQSKINYSFPNESLVRLFDKIINYNHKFKQRSLLAEDLSNEDRTNQAYKKSDLDNRKISVYNQINRADSSPDPTEPDLVDEPTHSSVVRQSSKNTQPKPATDKPPLVKDLAKEIRRRSKIKKLNDLKKPKSEIFTLKSNKSSSLDNLLASIRSK